MHPPAPQADERALPTDQGASALGWAAIALLLVHVVLAWIARLPGIETAQDDARYVLLARALRHLSYHELWRLDAPIHSLYPPGYPAMLALWGAVFSDRFDALVTLSILSSAGTLALVYAAVKRLWSPLVALLCLAVLAVNPYLIRDAGSLLSEPPFGLWSMLTLFLLTRGSRSRGTLIAAGAAAIAGALTRSVGVTLLAAVGLHWILERRWTAVVAFAVAGAATKGLWLAWTIVAPERYVGSSYVADATHGAVEQVARVGGATVQHFQLLKRGFGNLFGYLTTSIPFRLPVPTIEGTRADNIVSVVVVCLAFLTGLVVFYRRWRVAALYVVFTALLLAFWPWRIGRFTVPLLPVLVPVTIIGLGTLAGKVRASWSVPAMALCAVVLTVNATYRSAPMLAQMSRCERGTELPDPACLKRDQVSFFAAVRLVNQATPHQAAFLTAKPTSFYLYTGRKTAVLERALRQDSASFVPFLRRSRVSYVLLSSLQPQEIGRIAPLLQANCRAFALAGTFPPRTFLFQLPDAEAADPDDAACGAVAAYLRDNAHRDFEHDP